MTLVRWNPNRALLPDDVDRLFESVFRTRAAGSGGWTSAFAPAIDVSESHEGFTFHVDLPGVSQKDVKVSLLGDVLTIRGERKQSTESKDHNPHRVERRYGTFERSFTLGVPVRADQVKASYKDGVLEVFVPKAEEAKVREIEVQVAS